MNTKDVLFPIWLFLGILCGIGDSLNCCPDLPPIFSHCWIFAGFLAVFVHDFTPISFWYKIGDITYPFFDFFCGFYEALRR